jgi:hypothetical protein
MDQKKYNFNRLYDNINNYNNISNNENIDSINRMLNTEANDISIKFFSDDNINYLNNKIIAEILEKTKDELGQAMRIQPQQKEKMLTIMRYIYFEYNKNTYETDIEVQYMNEKFLEVAIPTIYSALKSYLKYLEDYDRSKNIPLNNPVSTTRKADLKPFSSLFGF